MKVLLLGANGQLGFALRHRMAAAGFSLSAHDLPEIDITAAGQVHHLFQCHRPDLVINAAAYTNVDRAESEPDAAMAANRDGPALLADHCRKHDAPLIHVSTDYVFDGHARRPYCEDDPVSPIGVYGHSKAAGESAIRKRCPLHVIVRTAWLYGVHGGNFVKTMLRLGAEREHIRVVDDQRGSPTRAEDLADAIVRISRHIDTAGAAPWGTYHYCGLGETTWYGLAQKIFEFARGRFPLSLRALEPISTSEYPTPARRPAYSVLDCTKIQECFAIRPIPWEAGLEETLAELTRRRPDASS